MKFLQHEDVPRWYHLFWDKSEGLCIRIHRFFLANCEHKNFEPYFASLETLRDYLPLFESYEPRLGQERFGVGDAIVLVGQDSDWMTYRIKLPTVLQTTGMACMHCEGTGKRYPDRKEWDDACDYCDGDKVETLYSYGEIGKVCFSLQILLNAVGFPLDTDVPTDKKQLFTMTTCCLQQSQGHSVGGYASPAFIRFLEGFSVTYEKSVDMAYAREVMKHVYCLLLGKEKDYGSFSCYTRGGQVLLSCPGNACEIHTEDRRKIGDGMGEGITCHNLDSSIQQLTLLSGLAALASLYDAT